MMYTTQGPFELPTREGMNGKVLDYSNPAKTRFWKHVDNAFDGLQFGVGCYLYCIRSGGGITPWYVGQTKLRFNQEVFESHKKVVYQQVLNERVASGTPVLFLIAKLTPSGNVGTSISKTESKFVERLLIERALHKNYDLMNQKDTKYLRELIIPGLLNNPTGAPTSGAQMLKKALRID